VRFARRVRSRVRCHSESGVRRVLTTQLLCHSLLPVKREGPLFLSLLRVSEVNVGVVGCTLSATATDRFSRGQMTIDILPDEALLEIFNFYLVEESERIQPWLPLVHVCRTWRSIVLASPRRLDIRVFYTPVRQVKVMLDIWPNLPIHISAHEYETS